MYNVNCLMHWETFNVVLKNYDTDIIRCHFYILFEKGIVLSSVSHGNRRQILYFNAFNLTCINHILICWLVTHFWTNLVDVISD